RADRGRPRSGRRRADRGPRRCHQRVRLSFARVLVQLAVATTRRQRLAHGGGAAARGHAERHEPSLRRPASRAPPAPRDRDGRPSDVGGRPRRREPCAVTVLLALFGGMALLLYGIRLSGESLQRAAGGRLRSLLTGLARKRTLAVVSGVLVTG